MPLTDAAIRNAKPAEKPLKLTDGAGLYLEVTPAGGKHWRYRFRLAGRENLFAIGAYPQITLADARKARDEARDLVKQGINPTQHRKQQKNAIIEESANTFALNAEAWFEEKNAPWSDGHRGTVRRIFDVDILPRIGKTPIRTLTAPPLLQVMKKIEARGAVTRAILARQIMGQVFDYAILHGRAETNPTTPLKRQIARRTVEHHRHLEERDIGDFLRKLEDYTGHITTRTALHLLMLTAVRPGEMCGAAWAEFDLEAATWTIPAKRMKMRRVHIVPLSRQAVELLRELEKVTGDGVYLFPTQGTKSETIPPATLRNAVKKLGYAERFSPHGARGTFSTLMNSRGYNADWIEKQLAHDDSDAVRRSYNHTQHLGDRAKMMQDYADLLDEKRQGAQVIQLRKVAA